MEIANFGSLISMLLSGKTLINPYTQHTLKLDTDGELLYNDSMITHEEFCELFYSTWEVYNERI